jgi:hypothetical protein
MQHKPRGVRSIAWRALRVKRDVHCAARSKSALHYHGGLQRGRVYTAFVFLPQGTPSVAKGA